MRKNFLSIVIPAYNNAQQLEKCLDSIFVQGSDGLEVIVVDNGSTDDPQGFILNRYPQVIFVGNKSNKGACFARNQGIRKARAEYILFMDSDAFLENGFFAGLKDLLKDLPCNIGGISPKIIDLDSQKIFSCGLRISPFYRVYDLGRGRDDNGHFSPSSVDGPNTCCGIFRREALCAIAEEGSCFDEDFFFLFEDADLALRLKKRGYSCLYSPKLVCYHHGQGAAVSRQRRRYLCFRNRLYMILKNHPGKGLLFFFLRSIFYDLPRTVDMALTNKYFFGIFRDLKAKAATVGRSLKTKRVKKIIIFNASSAIYGAERGLLHLIKALDGKFQISVVLPSQGPLVERIKNISGDIKIKTFPLPVLMSSLSPIYYITFPVLSLLNIIYFSFYIICNNYDLVVTNSLILPACGFIARCTGRKHVWYIREFFSYNLVNRILARFVNFSSDHIICQSEAIKNKLSFNGKAEVIYEALDSREHRVYQSQSARQELGLPVQAKIIAIISRFHPTKGQFRFLKQFSEELKRDQKLLLLLVGDISPATLRNRLYKKRIEKLIKTHDLHNVRLLGFRQDVDKIYSLTDVCVFPFEREEPFGIAVAEALSFGRMTFFPKRSGLKEVYELFGRGSDYDLKDILKVLSAFDSISRTAADGLHIPDSLSFKTYSDKLLSVVNSV